VKRAFTRFATAYHRPLKVARRENQHALKVFRLGKIVECGPFEVIAGSEELIRPEPYAASRSPAAWNAFLADLQQRWDGLWANPGR
jgi:urea transport system substrate-binding protein